MKKIPFHRPLLPKDVNNILSESISSGWVTTGPKVNSFEKKLSEYFEAKNVIVLNSCTAALHLGLAAIGIKKNDSFIVPTHTFVASVEVGEYLGATPILVDIDSETLNLNLDQVEAILESDIENKIKAIIPVHFAGQPVDMMRLNSLAKQYNLFILDDAAHATESISNIGKVGNTKFATAFSFYANKNITTAGEGGALATNDTQLADKIRKLSLHGMSRDGWKRFKMGNKWSYDVSELGYKYNLTDVAASFGIEQLSNIQKWQKRRLEIVNKYNRGLKTIDGLILPYNISQKNHARHLYIIQTVSRKWRINRNQLIEKLTENGIGIAVHYKPIHLHSYYVKKYGFKESDFPISKKTYESSVSIPLYPALSNSEIDYIIDVLIGLWKKFKA